MALSGELAERNNYGLERRQTGWSEHFAMLDKGREVSFFLSVCFQKVTLMLEEGSYGGEMSPGVRGNQLFSSHFHNSDKHTA